MQCSYCEKPAVIFRRYEGRALCRRHFIHSFEKIIKRTIRENNLIGKPASEPRDESSCRSSSSYQHIAVGLSGGKDSSAMLYLLNSIAKENRNMKLSAILVNEGIKGYRTEAHAKKLCKKLGVLLYVAYFKKEFGKTLDEIVKNHRSAHKNPHGEENLKACTFCGVLRRHLLNKTARKIKADRLAIGHNLDDEAQAIMANYIRGDILRGVRLGANAFTAEDDRFVPRIKPLREVPEKEVALYAILKRLPVDFNECPYAEESFRWTVRDVLNNLEEKYPGTKFSVVRTFDRIKPVLEKTVSGGKIGTCSSCGEPTSRKVCKVCELMNIAGAGKSGWRERGI